MIVRRNGKGQVRTCSTSPGWYDPPARRQHPATFLRLHDVKAAYTLLDRPEATPQHPQAGHTSLVHVATTRPHRRSRPASTLELERHTRAHPGSRLTTTGEVVLEPRELMTLRRRNRQQNGARIFIFRPWFLAIGSLGGHMNRKGDGLLGWQTLWRGMTRVATLVEGYRLGRRRFGE